MNRSKLLQGVGGLLIFMGLFYLVSPPSGLQSGEEGHDRYSLFICIWLFVSGVGVFVHRFWGFWTYVAGLALLLAGIVINSSRYGQSWSFILQATILMAAIFSLPALLVWLKRDRLRTGYWGNSDA